MKSGCILSPEGRQVFPDLSVLDNLMLGGNFHKDAENKKTLKVVYDLFPILEERKNQIGLTLSGGEQQMLRSKRPELSRGHWREKVSDLFGQTAHFSPVGSGRKKFPKKRTTSPVSVKWVLNEEIFKIFRSKPAKPSSGY